jgi:hypothetical protein
VKPIARILQIKGAALIDGASLKALIADSPSSDSCKRFGAITTERIKSTTEEHSASSSMIATSRVLTGHTSQARLFDRDT